MLRMVAEIGRVTMPIEKMREREGGGKTPPTRQRDARQGERRSASTEGRGRELWLGETGRSFLVFLLLRLDNHEQLLNAHRDGS